MKIKKKETGNGPFLKKHFKMFSIMFLFSIEVLSIIFVGLGSKTNAVIGVSWPR